MAKENIGIKPIKIVWRKNGNILQISFANNEQDAKKKITESKDRQWDSALMLFWSGTLGRYVSVPED